MFSYYGSKTSIAKLYPPPKHNLIIEPFAGAAKYSLLHWEKNVILLDKYDVIIKIWKWLQQCSEKDILSLPILKPGQMVRDYDLDCEEAYLFLGFVISWGRQAPSTKASPKTCTWKKFDRVEEQIKKIARNLYKIRHWKFVHGDYINLENEVATWFIDPPYQFGGEVYIESNKNINYSELANWCKSRYGQIIVCENTKADWMDFKPMKEFKGQKKKTIEAIWSNEPTNFDNEQQKIIF